MWHFFGRGNKFYSISSLFAQTMHKITNFWGKYILSRSFYTLSHIKKPELQKNGKPGEKKTESCVIYEGVRDQGTKFLF